MFGTYVRALTDILLLHGKVSHAGCRTHSFCVCLPQLVKVDERGCEGITLSPANAIEADHMRHMLLYSNLLISKAPRDTLLKATAPSPIHPPVSQVIDKRSSSLESGGLHTLIRQTSSFVVFTRSPNCDCVDALVQEVVCKAWSGRLPAKTCHRQGFRLGRSWPSGTAKTRRGTHP